MSLLQTINKGKRQKPPRLLIYGSEGIGKSSIAAQASKAIFIPTEDGLDHIECESFPLAKTYKDVVEYLKTLKESQHDYKTVVIDSLDWLEQLIWQTVCEYFGVKNIEKADGGFGKGFGHALTYWREIVNLLRDLRDEKGMLIILLAHARVEKFTDPESSTFDRFTPRLHKDATNLLCDWCDAILLATREWGAAKGDKGGGQRILRCMPSAVGVAKNRYNLPETMPLSWDNLIAELAAGA